ncbi:sulfotransferase family 2 domain-containing protein [Polynucleobacter sp. UK-Mo-2m-Kol15]|nr:sulfotransferase family 2 domain-containing protein [Polynucleobacter sp. UK-Mo-2m-Kol15]
MNTYFFVHTPKSGGSSFISFIDLNIFPNRFIMLHDACDGFNKEKILLCDSGFGGGHIGFGAHRMIKYPLKYFTLVRDPLTRAISHFNYALEGKNFAGLVSASFSETEFLVMRRKISLDQWLEKSLGGRNILSNMLTSSDQIIDGGVYEAAVENLKKYFIFTGLCEDMSATILVFCKTFNMSFPFYINTNKTRNSIDRIEPSEGAIQKFREDNAIDFKIYEFVKDDFEKKLN